MSATLLTMVIRISKMILLKINQGLQLWKTSDSMQQPLQQNININININIIQMHSSLRGAHTTRSAKYTTDKGRKEISGKKNEESGAS